MGKRKNNNQPKEGKIRRLLVEDLSARENLTNTVLDLIDNNNYLDAMAVLDQHLKSYLYSSAALALRARIYMLQGNLEKTRLDLDEVMRICRFEWLAWGTIGTIYKDRGNLRQSLEFFNEAIRLNSNDCYSLLHRGNVHQQLKSVDMAMTDLTAIIQKSPANRYKRPALISRAMLYRQIDKVEQARNDYTEALRLNPNDCSTLISRGILHHTRYSHSQAMLDMNEALRLNPKDPYGLANRGWVHFSQGNFEKAMLDLNEAIQLDPALALSFVVRGAVYRELGNFEKALENLDEAVRLAPTHHLPLAHRGETQRLRGKLKKAMNDLNKSIQLYPHDCLTLAFRGEALRQQDKLDAALIDLNKSLRRNPKCIEALISRSKVFLNQQKYESAFEDERAILKSNPAKFSLQRLAGFKILEKHEQIQQNLNAPLLMKLGLNKIRNALLAGEVTADYITTMRKQPGFSTEKENPTIIDTINSLEREMSLSHDRPHPGL